MQLNRKSNIDITIEKQRINFSEEKLKIKKPSQENISSPVVANRTIKYKKKLDTPLKNTDSLINKIKIKKDEIRKDLTFNEEKYYKRDQKYLNSVGNHIIKQKILNTLESRSKNKYYRYF